METRLLELVLNMEVAGRLLELNAQGRPALLQASFVEGRCRRRTVVWEAREATASEPQEGEVYIPQIGAFLEAFDLIKIYSARGIRIIFTHQEGWHDPSQARRFRRLIDTYGRRDAMPRLSASVIGLGRLGSKVASNLSEQGIGKLVLIDPQTIEHSNQQLTIYRRFPLGTPKVVALTDFLKGTPTVAIQKSLEELTEAEWAEVLDSDVIFVCVDSWLGRALACIRAMQAGIPLFEGGVHIVQHGNQILGLLGRVQTALPGLWCLFDLPEGLDREGTLREIGAMLLGRERSEPRPADPTLSDWVAALMVLLFRGALMGQGMRPRYLLRMGSDGHTSGVEIREAPQAIPNRCSHCRPLPGEQKLLVTPSSLAASATHPDTEGQGGFAGKTPRRSTFLNLRSWAVGICAWFLSLGLALGFLLAIREMIGFRGPYGEGLPNLGEFLWHFDSWRFEHTGWHYFGTITSAAALVTLPYIVFVLPLHWMRAVHRWLTRRWLRGKARSALQAPLPDLFVALAGEPAVPPFWVPPRMRRVLVWMAQGLAAITEVVALLVLFPLFKAWGGQAWLVLAFTGFIPIWVGLGIYYGVRTNHRALQRVIEPICGGSQNW